jgi:hypothetical protein
MKTLELSEASEPLLAYTMQATEEPLILVDQGQPRFAVIVLDNVDWETVTLSLNPQFMALIERSRARHRAEGGVSSEEMRRRLGLEEKRKG